MAKTTYSRFGKLILAGLFSVLSLAQTANAETLDVSAGAMMVKGNARINYAAKDVSAFTAGKLEAAIALGFGYFVIDGLFVGFDLISKLGFATAGSDSNIGAGPAVFYFFETNSIVYPYLGTGVHIGWERTLVNTVIQNNWNVDLTPTVGVVIALNQKVAVDLGLGTRFAFPLNTGKKFVFDGAAGYAGLSLFF